MAVNIGSVSADARVSDRALVFSRLLDAPREEVFDAWTDLARLARWWGPAGFTNPVCELDPRPGGGIRIHMQAPDGTIYPMTGEVREVEYPSQLVFTGSALDAEGSILFEALNTVTFNNLGGRTKLTVHAVLTMTTPGAERRLRGMRQSWSESLDRLAELW